MPKKTRREKILAQEHRKAHEPVPVARVVHLTTPQTEALSMDTVEYRAIKMDLVKTLVLATIAISVEFLLYIKIGRG